MAFFDFIEPKIRPNCSDGNKVVSTYNPESDTCQDLCIEGNTYFLRRLQKYDNLLFKYETNKKLNQTQYARCCQGGHTNSFPIPLNYNPYDTKKILPVKELIIKLPSRLST